MALKVPTVDREIRESIRDFLYLESKILDERRFRGGGKRPADDAKYEIPVRVTREKLAEWELSPTSRIFDDTKRTLEFRVERLEAWSRTGNAIRHARMGRAAAVAYPALHHQHPGGADRAAG